MMRHTTKTGVLYNTKANYKSVINMIKKEELYETVLL